MQEEKYSIGKEGFVWFIGTVEDRNDPEQLGRIRVRCFGWHTENKQLIPTESLPWAFITQAPNNPASYTPKEGDMVFGFFLDAASAQNPVVIGVIPGKPTQKPNYQVGFSDPRTSFSDKPTKEPYPISSKINEPTLSRLSRNKATSTIIETRKKNLKKNIKSARGSTWSEPSPTFSPVYPFNYAHETESGHAFEMDDTPGKERVQLAHKIGAFIEFDADGNRIEKVIKDNYTVIMSKNNVYIGGKCNITIDGDCDMKVGGKFTLEAASINFNSSGKVNVKGNKINVDSDSSTDIKAGASLKVGTEGSLSLSGSSTTLSGGTVDIPAALVNIQGGTSSSPDSASLDTLEEVTVTAKRIQTESKLLNKLKYSASKVDAAIKTVGDKVNQATNTISNIQIEVSKKLAPVTEAVNKAENILSDVDKAYKKISKQLDPIEKIIGKEIFPKTSYISNAIGELDKFSTKLDKIYDPLYELNEKVVELNAEIHDKIFDITDVLNSLNENMNNLNNRFNLSSTNKKIPSIGTALNEALPDSSSITTDYIAIESIDELDEIEEQEI
jgi:hypothetical protein